MYSVDTSEESGGFPRYYQLAGTLRRQIARGRRQASAAAAARLGHSGGGATTLWHYADPVPEVDRRAAAYLAKLTAGSAAQSG